MKLIEEDVVKSKYNYIKLKNLGGLYVALKPSAVYREVFVEVVRMEIEGITSKKYTIGNLKITKNDNVHTVTTRVKGQGYSVQYKVAESLFSKFGYSFDAELYGDGPLNQAILLLGNHLSKEEVRVYRFTNY